VRFDERITQAVAQTELLLAAEVRHSIELIARSAAPAATQPLNQGRTSGAGRQ
jgi:hypothetical protein